jgi:hypothetical protein
MGCHAKSTPFSFNMKKCPYCAEEIQDEAIKCKHCGEFLNGVVLSKLAPQAVSPSKNNNGLPWYYSNLFLIFMLLSIGPLALPLIWFHPKMTPKWKISITVITLVITYLIYILLVMALKKIYEMIELLGGF